MPVLAVPLPPTDSARRAAAVQVAALPQRALLRALRHLDAESQAEALSVRPLLRNADLAVRTAGQRGLHRLGFRGGAAPTGSRPAGGAA